MSPKKGIINPKIKYNILYSLAFIGVFLLVYFIFLKNDRSLVWMPDGLAGYYSDLRRYHIEGGNFFQSLFDFTLGLGRDVSHDYIRMIANPPLILSYFFSIKNLEVLYALIAILGLYLSGLFFSVFAFRFNKKQICVLTGALLYAFSGFAILGIRHIYFIEVLMALFPLFLLGIEKVLNREKPFFMVFIIFLYSVNSLYYLFIVSVLGLIYALVRFFVIHADEKKKGILFLKQILTILGCYVFGLFMSIVSWLPNLLIFSSNGRIGSAVSESLFIYAGNYYANILRYMFSGSFTIGYWTELGFTAVAFAALVLLFMRRKNKARKSLLPLWIIGTVMLCFPIFGYFCSGLSNISNRWCFGYAMVFAMIVTMMMEEMTTLTKKQLIILSAVFVVYLGICLIWNMSLVIILGFSCIAAFLIFLWIINLVHVQKLKKWILPAICFFACGSLILNANMVYCRFGFDYKQEFLYSGKVEEVYMRGPYEGLSNYLKNHPDETFFRVGNYDATSYTNTTGYQLNGLAEFNSSELSYDSFLKENENAGLSNLTGKTGMNSRTAMMEIASVKYYVTNSEDPTIIPYGYQLISRENMEENGIDLIYENQFALPIGYAYDSYVSREDYDKLEAIDRQNILLSSAMLEEESDFVEKENIETDSYANKILNVEYDNISLNGQQFSVQPGGGSITYTIEPTCGEIYVRVNEHHYLFSDESWKVYAEANGVRTQANYYGDPFTYYVSGTKLLNLGYFEEPVEKITVSISNGGEYTLEGIEILTQPMDSYEKKVEKLLDHSLKDVEKSGDTITGNISVDKDSILCFSIPFYSLKGWKLLVDGVETPLFRANSMYIGAELPSGNHQIQMSYQSPYLVGSLIISLTFIALYLVLIVLYRKKNFRNLKLWN